MADAYWLASNTTNYGNWTSIGNWKAAVTGTANASSIPTVGDTVYLTSSLSTIDKTIYMNGNQACDRIVMNEYAERIDVRGGTLTVPASNQLALTGQTGRTIDCSALPSSNMVSYLDLYGVTLYLPNNQVWYRPLTRWGALNVGCPIITPANSNISITLDGGGYFLFGYIGTSAYSGGTVISTGGRVKLYSEGAFGSGNVVTDSVSFDINSANLPWTLPNNFSVKGTTSLLYADGWDYDNTINLGTVAGLGFSGNVTLDDSTTVKVRGTQQVITQDNRTIRFKGQVNASAPHPLSLVSFGNTTSNAKVYFQGESVGTFSGKLSVGAYLEAWLAQATSTGGTPNQLNNASEIEVSANGFLKYAGVSAYTIPYTVSGAGTLEVLNAATINFGTTSSPSTLTHTGAFKVSAASPFTSALTQTVKFNSAAQLGVATSYTLGVAAGSTGLTWTNLTQVIEYAGAVDVDNSKTIYIDHDALNGGTFVYRNSGAATLNHTGDIYHNRATISETLSLDASGGPIIIWGQLREASTGILSVTKTGTYAATLRGINTFRGNLTLSAGMTYGVSLSALGANNAATVQVSGGAALSMDVACNYNAGKVLAISGVGPVMGTGNTGSLILNWTGTHTYSGGVSATGATYVRATATSTLNATVTSNNSNLRLGAAAGNTVTFSGAVSGTNGLLIGRSTTYPSATVEGSDTGTVVLGAANTFTAPSKINFGTLSVDADNKLGTAPASPTTEYLVIGQGTVFKATGTFTLAANRGIAVGPSGYDLGTGASSIEVASGQTLTYAGVIANNANGAGTLAKIGTGKLVLSNANTYSGGTDITTGTLRATHLNALGTGPVVQSAETVLQTPNSNGKIVFGGAYSNNGGILRIGGST